MTQSSRDAKRPAQFWLLRQFERFRWNYRLGGRVSSEETFGGSLVFVDRHALVSIPQSSFRVHRDHRESRNLATIGARKNALRSPSSAGRSSPGLNNPPRGTPARPSPAARPSGPATPPRAGRSRTPVANVRSRRNRPKVAREEEPGRTPSRPRPGPRPPDRPRPGPGAIAVMAPESRALHPREQRVRHHLDEPNDPRHEEG